MPVDWLRVGTGADRDGYGCFGEYWAGNAK